MPDKNKLYGVLFWILFTLLIGCLFAINYKKMISVMEQTGFFDNLRKKNGTVAEKPVTPAEKQPSVTEELPPAGNTRVEPLADPKNIVRTPADFTSVGTAVAEGKEPVSDAKTPGGTAAPGSQTPPSPAGVSETVKPVQTPAAGSKPPNQTVKEPPPPVQAAPIKPSARTQTASLWFVVIDDDGTVLRKETHRTLPVSDSPLSDTIKALLAGPDRTEREKGYMSLVPEGAALLSATVSKERTAILNFSDAFQFNKYGVEGYFGQLMQIVFTATAFPTVTNVQILIEGEKKDYLGSEGVWIGTPLSRGNFR